MARLWFERVEREIGVPDVEGRVSDGSLVLGRWAQAPSSIGMGREEGNVVSVCYMIDGLEIDVHVFRL